MTRLESAIDIVGMLLATAFVALMAYLAAGCAPQPVVDIQGAAGRMKVGDTTRLSYKRIGDREEFEVSTSRERDGASGSGGLQVKVPVQPLP